MGIIIWGLWRQIEALRQSVGHSIQAIHSGRASPPISEKSAKWLSEQGLDSSSESILQAMEGFVESLEASGNRLDLERLTEANRSAFQSTADFGKSRSNAGWNKLEKFIVTSAFVRLLGAYEQFELDVLKCLLFYRPLGRTGPSASELEEEEATEDVICEAPKDKDPFLKPPIWDWIRGQAVGNHERRKILKRAYGIELKREEKHWDVWYEQRNAIAHGRAAVEFELRDYCEVEFDVSRVARQLSYACREKYKLII